MYILGIDPGAHGISWALMGRYSDGDLSCRKFDSRRSDHDLLLGPAILVEPDIDAVAIEDFTFIARGMGGPAIETCVNIGRVVQECIHHKLRFHRITRQRVKGFLSIGRARQRRTVLTGKQTEVDAANRQAVRMRIPGLDTHFMSRDHIAALAVALTMDSIMREEKTMEGVA